MVVGGSDNKPHNAACIQSTRGPEPQDCQASLIVPLVPRTTRLQPCLLRSMLWLGASHYISFAAHGWEMWCLRYTRRNERKTFSWNPFMHHWKCSKHSYVYICLEVRGQSLHRASHWPGANIGVGEAGQPLNHLYPQCWDYSTYHYVHFFFFSHEFWGVNSGPCACTANSLLPRTSTQPLSFSFLFLLMDGSSKVSILW